MSHFRLLKEKFPSSPLIYRLQNLEKFRGLQAKHDGVGEIPALPLYIGWGIYKNFELARDMKHDLYFLRHCTKVSSSTLIFIFFRKFLFGLFSGNYLHSKNGIGNSSRMSKFQVFICVDSVLWIWNPKGRLLSLV